MILYVGTIGESVLLERVCRSEQVYSVINETYGPTGIRCIQKPWLSIIFLILRPVIMDDVYPTIGSIKDLIPSTSYLASGLRIFQYIRHHYSNRDARRLWIERLPLWQKSKGM